jgi:hypothetical protein
MRGMRMKEAFRQGTLPKLPVDFRERGRGSWPSKEARPSRSFPTERIVGDVQPVSSTNIGDRNTLKKHPALIQSGQFLVAVSSISKGLHEVSILISVKGERSAFVNNKDVLRFAKLEEIGKPRVSKARAEYLQIPITAETGEPYFNPMLFNDRVEKVGCDGR